MGRRSAQGGSREPSGVMREGALQWALTVRSREGERARHRAQGRKERGRVGGWRKEPHPPTQGSRELSGRLTGAVEEADTGRLRPRTVGMGRRSAQGGSREPSGVMREGASLRALHGAMGH
jgi:hypothetical protein